MKTLVAPEHGPAPRVEALFSPGLACRDRLTRLISSANRTIDVCVYTITDDHLSRTILEAHRKKGLRVRVVSDDSKVQDLGADIEMFDKAGIPIVIDYGPQHIHHKFAIFDGCWLATGSFNWTRAATRDNHENLIVTDDPRLTDAFQAEFDALWKRYTPGA